MKCRQVVEHLNELVDGTLRADVAARAQAHLERCAVCAAERSALENTIATLRIGALESPSREHVASVMAAVVADATRAPVAIAAAQRRAPNLWRTVASHAVAAALGALLVYGIVEFTNSDTAAHRVSGGDAIASVGGGLGADAGSGVSAPSTIETPAVEVATRYVFVPYAARIVQRAPAPTAALASVDGAAFDEQLARSVALGAAAVERGVLLFERFVEAIESQTRRAELVAENVTEVETSDVAIANSNTPTAAETSIAVQTSDSDRPPPWARTATNRGVVVVGHDDQGVVLSVRGDMHEVVPALIERLTSTEPGVREAVERQLLACARELGVEPPRASVEAADQPWWRSDRGRVAAELGREAAAGPIDGAAWRAWWIAARGNEVALVNS